MTAESAPRTLASIDREIMLRNAWRVTGRRFVENRLLWGFVASVCGVGSTSAHAICRELGWNPDATEMPPTNPTSGREGRTLADRSFCDWRCEVCGASALTEIRAGEDPYVEIQKDHGATSPFCSAAPPIQRISAGTTRQEGESHGR
ncbi:MAG: hypothetical protein ACF8XB_09075 [Planctomycetota bacterium JB042]